MPDNVCCYQFIAAASSPWWAPFQTVNQPWSPGCQGLLLLTVMDRLCMCLMMAPKRTPALLLAAFWEWVGHSGVQEGFREKLENQVGSLPGCQSILVRPPD